MKKTRHSVSASNPAVIRGTRRYGADLQYLLTENLVINGEVYHDDVFVNDNKRNSATANIEYFRSNYRLSSGLIYTRDDLGTGETNTSTLLTAGASRSFLQDSLTLRARAEAPLDGNNDSIDYPGNITLGADYLLNERISLFAEQEFAYGNTLDSSNTRVGLRSTPWHMASHQYLGGTTGHGERATAVLQSRPYPGLRRQ